MAGTKYTAGSPELSAYISGANEVTPGKDVSLTMVIQNTGLNEFKFINSGIVDRDDLPNTAKFLTVTLNPGDAPIIIKSDPQMVGDLKGGYNANAIFSIKVKTDAAAGTYQIPISLNYTYLYQADQLGVDTMQYRYKTVTQNLTAPIKIKPDVSIDVLSATPEHLNVGTEGYLNMKIQNTGSEYGTKSIVKILRSGNSPIVPTDSSVYIGDFPPGSIVDCRYKVAVSSDAEHQTYPVDVVVLYQNKEGDFVTSRSDTIGVPVGGKADFKIISAPPEMNPGNKKVITVDFKNTGETTVYSAQARISAVDPFTSNDDVAYLGDLKPGQVANASYIISIDRSATIKEYGIDSEIRYRDALDNTYVSDTMKVKINVTSPAGIMTLLSNPIYLSILVAVIIGIIYAVYHFRKKQ
ncbi:S-layer protein [uncultured Methanoregula sp.]|uniref:COG1361 S-layer family protein n=1 Tax=uncultured Methanoregula sp. TaxID=1005933 RepID=UPI002AAA8DC0|nr:S-layer protein [uncultured Methanoregula sp.]